MLLLFCFERRAYCIRPVTIAIQYLCKRFKIQICNGAILYFFNFLSKFYYLMASPKLFPIATLLLLFFNETFLSIKETQKLLGNMFSIHGSCVFTCSFKRTKSQIPKMNIPIKIIVIIINYSI